MSEVLLDRLERALATMRPRIIACSGGIDSLLLAIVAHRADAAATRIVHAVSPAVQSEGSHRVRDWARRERLNVQFIDSGEFEDEQYLSNPANRCYFCKSHLYAALNAVIATAAVELPDAVVLSGTNLDDLGEYRPGLQAASEAGVRHPYVEAKLGKAEIRALARHLDLEFAELPASPCLASRLYTGTRVTASRLRAVEAGEELIRRETGIGVVRCRLREDQVFIEVGDADKSKLTATLVARVANVMRNHEPAITDVLIDTQAYKPGRAFIVHQQL
jgi:uncharacterized protein